MLELPRIKAPAGISDNKLEEWCYFFRNLPTFVGVPKDINPRFYKIMDKLRIKDMTDSERAEYFRSGLDDNEREEIARANFDYGKEEGLEEGEARGRAEEKLENARKMLEGGIDMALIEKITGLSSQEVKKLLNCI